MLQIGFCVLSMAIMAQSIATNQRLDAIMELFDDDHDAYEPPEPAAAKRVKGP